MLKAAIQEATGEEIQAIEIPRFSEARQAVEDHLDAQAVFISLDGPTRRGGNTAHAIKEAHPNLKVILTSSLDGQHEAVRLGLDGFLSKWDFADREKVLPFFAVN